MTAPRILVFSRTTGYRHDSIPDGHAAFAALGAAHGFTVLPTEDPGELAARLPGSRAVVFLSASGEVLTPAARDALRRHCAAGGGFVGVHAASTAEPGWPWYGELIGARFAGHPDLQPGELVVEDHGHPATAHLPRRWRLTDEWYDFAEGPGPGARVLASADEHSYRGGRTGGNHPLVWCHRNTGGPVFHTALGHEAALFADPDYRRHLLGGLAWAAGLRMPGPGPGAA
ncbi:ThuA domain-containing protein [Streptomyces sodiiphilus]|uniref:ThuA domain-containing protein n=1 Tax=Streptomyces sodiiphilus TaxID=226217 RepID=A0ABP5ACB6_9ACTN